MIEPMAQVVENAELPRRTFLVRIIQGVHATIGATLAFILGSAVLAPAFRRREPLWLSAGDVTGLPEGQPSPVTLHVAHQDGAVETVHRRVVFLVRSGDTVRAIDSTCTHLGCRTRYDAASGHIECPCHGGRYDANGGVVAGPPPRPLETLPTRLEGSRILVQV